jgi:hypothetical protein
MGQCSVIETFTSIPEGVAAPIFRAGKFLPDYIGITFQNTVIFTDLSLLSRNTMHQPLLAL